MLILVIYIYIFGLKSKFLFSILTGPKDRNVVPKFTKIGSLETMPFDRSRVTSY